MSTNHTIVTEESIDYELYPLVTGAERLAVFEQARGIFKGRVKDIVAELDDIRNEFDRDLPTVS